MDGPEGWSTEPPDTTLPKVIKRESGGKNLPASANYDYPNSSASGYLQIQDGTWRAWTKEFGVGQNYRTANEAPESVQKYIGYKADQKYGPNSSYTWAASAPPGGYPNPKKHIDGPPGWTSAPPKKIEGPPGWSSDPPKAADK